MNPKNEEAFPITQIGWAMKGFESSDDYKDDGVGDCEYSYGYDGQRQCKWHDVSSEWGQQFDAADGMVVGVAADFTKGELMFGLNGDWNDPMGSAFTGIDTSVNLFPAITGHHVILRLNFGYDDFKYGPPDPSFIGLKDAVPTT